jgi:hypothetical protein
MIRTQMGRTVDQRMVGVSWDALCDTTPEQLPVTNTSLRYDSGVVSWLCVTLVISVIFLILYNYDGGRNTFFLKSLSYLQNHLSKYVAVKSFVTP